MGKIGQIPWNRGKKLTKEHCENLSIAHKGNKPWNAGLVGVQKCSEEAKKKHSESAKRYGLGKSNKGKPAWNKGKVGEYRWSKTQRAKWGEWAKSEEAQRAFKRQGATQMRAQVKKETAPERAIADILDSMGVEYQKQVMLADITVADFYVPVHKLVIYADGNYWHKYPAGLPRDKAQTRALRKLGLTVLRFWESDIASDRVGVVKKILRIVG